MLKINLKPKLVYQIFSFLFVVIWLFLLPKPSWAVTYYVSPSGNDSNPGTIQSPWQTLQFAFPSLQAGDTINLRAGIYYESNLTLTNQGTVSNPIIIQSYPGEQALIDGSMPDYKTVPNTDWELVDAAISLYRTSKTFSGTVGAWLINDDTQLIQYTDLANMDTTNYYIKYTQDANGNITPSDPLYYGPGVQLRSEGKIYIRLQPNPNDLFDTQGNPIPPIPADTNPNNNSISVFTSQNLLTIQGASYLYFKDLIFQYSRRMIDLEAGANNITFENSIFHYGTGGILNYGADSLIVKNSEFNNGVPETMYWTDVKNEDTEAGPEFQSGAIGVPSNSVIESNFFRRGFDGFALVEGVSNVIIRNNYLTQFKDDAINLSLDNSNIEIDHNLLWYDHSGISLFKHTGIPGEVYIHHNVVDGSLLTRTGRPGNYREQAYIPWAGGNPFGGHDGKSAAHWKLYNNTFISQKGRQPGTSMSPDAVLGNSEKYLYNNIFYALDNRILLSNDQESEGSHYDGNVFWQGMLGTMFSNFANGGTYASLAELQTSGSLWETNGMQIDPGFDIAELLNPTFDRNLIWNRYIPTNPQVFTPGVSYSGLNWPGIEGITYRGAVPPQTSSPSPVPSAQPSPSPIAGDINQDGAVDVFDMLLTLIGYSGSGNCNGFWCDLNADSKVNLFDTAIVIRDWLQY